MPFARPHRPRHTPNSSYSCSSSPPSTPDSSTLSLSSHVQQKQNQKQKRRLGSTTILAALRLRLSREPHADSESDSDPGNMGQAQAKPAGPCATHPAFAYPMSGETSTHRMPGGMDDVADSALALSEIHPPLSAPPALGSASASKTLKSRSLARKLSTKRPHATVSHPAAHRAKAARTLGEEMAAFEKLVHQAELAAGIDATAPHPSDGPGAGARPARLRMSLPPTPPKVRPVTSANDLASTSASAIPARMRSSSGLQRRSSTFSTQSSGVSPTASRRAEREWRAKVAALAASSATMTPLYHTPSRSSIVVSPPIRGPVPPRRPFPAAVPATPLMVRSASVDSQGSSNLPVTPPAPRTPLMTVPLKHDRTHSSSRSFASRRSFETLGHHAGQGLGLGSCFPTPSPGGDGEGHERHTRQASVPQSISSYYLGVSSRPPSAAAASLLGQVALTPMPLSPSSPESPAMYVDVARGEDVDMANAEESADAAVPPRLPTPVSASPLFVPRVISPTPPAPLDTVLPNSEAPATSDLPATRVEIAQTPERTTFAAKPQPADSPSVYSQRSASTSTRTRSMPSPPSFSPAHTPRRKPTHGLTLDFVRTPLHSRARHLASGSPGPGTPTYSPTTAYILCAPIENVWANTLAFHDSPPRPDAHAHPYALPPWGLSGAVSAPVKPPKTRARHKWAQGEAAKGKERIPLAPAPAPLQQQQRSEEQVGSDPFLTSVSQGSCTPRGANALREVNLTPGMDTGKRPPKSGLPMDDLTRWLATTSIAA